MRRSLLNDVFVVSGTAVLAAAAGFVGGAYYLDRATGPEGDRLEVLAECGFAAGEEILGSTLRLRCGLEQAEIERLFAEVVEGLGFDRLAEGRRPSDAQIREAGQRLELVVDAVEALIAGLQGEGGGGAAPSVDWAVEVAVEGGGEVSPGAAPVPVRFAPENVVIGRPETEAEAVLLDRVQAKCGAAVRAAIKDSIIEVACGPKPEEVQALIDRFVEQTGAAGLREALAADKAARETFIRELSASFGLEDDLVAALIAELESGELSDQAAAGTLDGALRERMVQALLLLRIGQTAEALGARQAELAEAIVAGDAAVTERLARETGEMLRPLADDLAPERLPPLVVAARDAEEARKRIAAADFVGGIRGYVAAADAARAADWPLMAAGFELAVAGALTDARALADTRADFGEAEDPASRIWLEASGQLQDQALDLGLAAADRLVDRGERATSDDLLARSAAVLARLEPLVSGEEDPGRHVALMSQLAMLRRAQARRSGDFEQLRQAAAAADAAIAVAEKLGEEEHVRRLMPWAIVQLELARWTGDSAYLDKALSGFKKVAAARDPDEDLIGWASAENNIAVVLSDKASLGNDAGMLREAADTYRRIAKRVDPEAEPDAWATYTRNLANSLVQLGGWEGSVGPVREAIGELEKLRAFEAQREAGLAAADTLEKLARAWWQIGYLERDVAAHDKAAALMRDAVEVYNPETAARFRVAAELQLGDILREAGELATDPGKLTSAAETYAAARVTTKASGQRRLYVDATLRQAGALRRATTLGGVPNDTADPVALVAEAVGIIEGLSPDEITPEWERLGAEAERLDAELGGAAAR